MCTIMEQYKEAAVQEAEKRGEKRGKKQGENRMGKLMLLLFNKNRLNDAQRAEADPQYREQLFIEFEL